MITTARLLLRRWRDDDLAPLAALNADPVVMEHFPAPLSRAESDALVARVEACFDEHGYGLWAVDVDGRLAGFAGLWPLHAAVPVEPTVAPVVEVGWRLATWAWRHGYATEAAAAAIRDARGRGLVGDLVSFTAVGNVRSQRVMQRLGFRREPAEDFDHPALPQGHPLRRHVLYRLPGDRPPNT